MRLLLVALLTISILTYAAAIRFAFARPNGMPQAMKALAAAGSVTFFVHLAAILLGPAPRRGPAFAATALYLFALSLFVAVLRANRRRPLSVAFSSDAPRHLVTTGPYRFVRHPAYLAYSMTWLAGAVATLGWSASISAAAIITIYFVSARLEERKFLASRLSGEYASYRKRAGMFFPRITGSGHP